MLHCKAFLKLSVHSRHLDCFLTLDEPDPSADRVLGKNRGQHVHVVKQQVAFLDPALVLLGYRFEHFA